MNRLNDLRIGSRLGLGFAAVLLLMLAIVTVGFLQLERTATTLKALGENEERARIAQDWLGKTQLNMARTLAIAKAAGQPEIEQHFAPLIKATSADIGALQKQIETGGGSSASRGLWEDLARQRTVYTDLRKRLFELLRQSDQPAVEALLRDQLVPAGAAYEASVLAVQTQQLGQARSTGAMLLAETRKGETALFALLVAGLLVGAAMAWLITRSVTVPLRAALETTRVIASSDLSQTIRSERRDELGDLLRALGRMQSSLRDLVGQVRVSTDSIGTASSEIASGNLDLSGRTEETSSNLQQTASSMSELTETVRQSAESARHASELAHSAATVAERGGSVVAEVVETMQGINDSSRRIGDIVGVIDGIAFQTNILALNAAVEAARAGEQGRGFAVVAAEVRQLAQRSAGAAREIKSLIGASVERVEGGTRLVASAGATMQEIVGSVRRVSEVIQSITRTTTEQSLGLVHINTAVGELDRMTQQNAALVEQSSAAAESLKEQTETLSRVVGTFRLESDAAPRPAHV